MRLAVAAVVTCCVLAACTGEFTGEDPGDDESSSSSSSTSSSSSSGEPASSSGASTSGATSGSTSSGSSSGAPTYTLTAEEQAFLDRINQVRRDLAPGASPPLNPVIWDYEIGANLRAWPPCSGSSPTRPAGTSTLYGSIDARMTVDELLNAMVDSRQFYNLATNECSRGTGQCLGYTNMVQRGVARVACVMPMDSACDPPDALGAGIQEKWRHWACTFAPLPDDKIKPY